MMINLGIIGCGRLTETVHLPVLQRLSAVHLYAACDTREERLRLMKQVFGIPRLYDDWTKFMADPGLDAVLIATPADSQPALATATLEAHKHVMVEKPFALTVSDAEALARRARESSLVSMVGLNYRFHPLACELKLTIERGAVGRPLAVFTTFMTSAKQSTPVTGYKASLHLGGGVFHDKVVHVLDVLRFLFESEVVRGRATARSELHPHDFGMIELELANGVHVSGSFCDRAVPDNSYVIFGDEGKATVNFTRPAGVALYRQEFSRSRAAKLWAYARQTPRIVSGVRLSTPSGRLSSYRKQWQHFLACIESGSRPRPNFDDGLAVTRTIAQLLDSLGESTKAGLEPDPWGSAGDMGRRLE